MGGGSTTLAANSTGGGDDDVFSSSVDRRDEADAITGQRLTDDKAWRNWLAANPGPSGSVEGGAP